MATVSERDSMTRATQGKEGRSKLGRNSLAFWMFGLSNNFTYIVILTAAQDILNIGESTKSSESVNFSANLTIAAIPYKTSDEYLQCNDISTGAILLADIIPALIVKLTFPMFMQRISYPLKICLVSCAECCGLFLIAFATDLWVRIIGVGVASFATGLGEIAFLSLTTFYHSSVVTMWSSGSGASGLFGSLGYAGLTTLGLSVKISFILMVIMPVLRILMYVFVLASPQSNSLETDDGVSGDAPVMDEASQKKRSLTLSEKIVIIPDLFKYMVPLTVVYFAEYFINQGLIELLYFTGACLSPAEQYRWYQFDYQVGCFISRSSVYMLKINKLWILSLLQWINLIALLLQVFFRYIPSFFIILAIVLWEGLLGGATYGNAFYKITKETPEEKREYCLGLASVADSIGIVVAAFLSLPAHNAICKLDIRM